MENKISFAAIGKAVNKRKRVAAAAFATSAPKDARSEASTENRVFVTAVEESGIKIADGQDDALDKKPLVIPLPESDRLSDITPKEPKQAKTAGNGYSTKKFGLQIMKPKDKQTPTVSRPILSRTRPATDKDGDSVPEETPPDAYERVPVDEFGAALLRGMGWKEGDALGQNRNGLAKPREFKPRPDKLGLGAQALPNMPSSVMNTKKPSGKK